MKSKLNGLYLQAAHLDRQHIQLLLLLVSLILLVIGAGAPVGGSEGNAGGGG
jgi:hypothetical protein